MAKNGKLRGFFSWLWRTRAGNRVLSLSPLALALTAAAVIQVFDLRLTGILEPASFSGLPAGAVPAAAVPVWSKRC